MVEGIRGLKINLHEYFRKTFMIMGIFSIARHRPIEGFSLVTCARVGGCGGAIQGKEGIKFCSAA